MSYWNALRRCEWMLSLGLLVAIPGGVVAQISPTENGPATEPSFATKLTIEQLEQALAEVEQSSASVDVKLQAADNYKAAIKNLESAAANETRWQALSAETTSVGERAEQLKKLRAELKDKKPSVDTNLKLQELEQLLPATELQLATAKKARIDAEAELQSRSPRRKEIHERMAAIQERLDDTHTQLRSLSTAESTIHSQSLTARFTTRRATLEKEKTALEAELAKFDIEESADFLQLRIEVSALKTSDIEKQIAAIKQQVSEARDAAAAKAVKIARWEAINAAPALKRYAEQNQQLAEQSRTIAGKLVKTEHSLTTAIAIHENLIRDFAQSRKKVDSVGLTSSVGALLRNQITTLPNIDERRKAVLDRQNLINEIQFQLIEHEEQHQALTDVDSSIGAILAAAPKDTPENLALLESAARDLMNRRSAYLDDLVRSTRKYFDTLIELDMVDRHILNVESEYKTYIDQRVLWIRSGRPLSEGVQLEEFDTWLLRPAKWSEAGIQLAKDVKSHPILYLLFLAVIAILLIRGSELRRLIADLGTTAQKANCRTISPTIRVLFVTTILSLAVPLVFIFVGWRLNRSGNEYEFTQAIGNGCLTLGILWAALEWMRQVCRVGGLGEDHFGWSPNVSRMFRRELQIAIYVGLPVAFVTATLASSDGVHERSDIQRIAFVLGMGIAALTAFRLLRPQGIFRDYYAANKNSMVVKLKYLYPIAVAMVPGSLAALAIAGYFFTAQTLLWRLFASCLFVFSLLVVRSIFFRMLLLRRRYLSIEQSRQRAAAAQLTAQRTSSDGAAAAAGLPQSIAGIATEDKHADISAHSIQSRRFVGSGVLAVALVGMWMIWIQVIPALSMVGSYPLWGISNSVTAATTSAMPANPLAAVNPGGSDDTLATPGLDDPTTHSVTVADLALAILIIIATIVLFRNGPGLLEISVLQQLPFDASVRYAITTLISYAIVMIGTISACSTIGLQWSQIQWLATALTFGLAFGLQEMFANFVAGLIILLERPIRVGDVVTVDDVTGVVSRIRIRATSITNWDRKEYVVPNKEFITGRLLNWTLSDNVNRVVVEVGLAYGSDTEQARELLLQVANDHPSVLKDPPSIASFEGFGDNSLQLALRTFLPSLENRLQVITELHTAIDKAFRKAGLEIAFPQRDLHIRTMTRNAALSLQSDLDDDSEEVRDAA